MEIVNKEVTIQIMLQFASMCLQDFIRKVDDETYIDILNMSKEYQVRIFNYCISKTMDLLLENYGLEEFAKEIAKMVEEHKNENN